MLERNKYVFFLGPGYKSFNNAFPPWLDKIFCSPPTKSLNGFILDSIVIRKILNTLIFFRLSQDASCMSHKFCSTSQVDP